VNLLAHFEGHQRLRSLNALSNLTQDIRRFRIRNGGWRFMGAEKASHLRCVPDEVIGFVSELHFGQHVAGEELALGSVLLSVANFYELLRGNDDFFEEVIQTSMLCLLSDGIGDLALEIREGLNDVPAFRHERRARGA
jgi:hypothetical protein